MDFAGAYTPDNLKFLLEGFWVTLHSSFYIHYSKFHYWRACRYNPLRKGAGVITNISSDCRNGT